MDANKRELIASDNYRFGDPKALAAHKDILLVETAIRDARAVAVKDAQELLDAQEEAITQKNREAQANAEVTEEKRKQVQEDRESYEWAEKSNKKRAEFLEKQAAERHRVEVEGPKQFRAAVNRYRSTIGNEASAPLASGANANSVEAANRASMHGLNKEADTDIQRAILEVAKREAEDTAALKDAILDYMKDPEKGFVI